MKIRLNFWGIKNFAKNFDVLAFTYRKHPELRNYIFYISLLNLFFSIMFINVPKIYVYPLKVKSLGVHRFYKMFEISLYRFNIIVSWYIKDL